jgi:hypothetical protein
MLHLLDVFTGIELSYGGERLLNAESAPPQYRYGVSVLVAPSMLRRTQLPASAVSVSGNNLLFIPQQLGLGELER